MIKRELLEVLRLYRENRLAQPIEILDDGVARLANGHGHPFMLAHVIDIVEEMLADIGAAFEGQSKADAVQIDRRLGLVAHRVLRVAEILPDGDHHEGEQDGVEHADHGKFETGDLVVQLQPVDAVHPPRKQGQADAVGRGPEGQDQPRHP